MLVIQYIFILVTIGRCFVVFDCHFHVCFAFCLAFILFCQRSPYRPFPPFRSKNQNESLSILLIVIVINDLMLLFCFLTSDLCLLDHHETMVNKEKKGERMKHRIIRPTQLAENHARDKEETVFLFCF